MEFIALWEMIQRRWWLILLPTLVAFLLLLPSLADITETDQSYSVAMRFTAAAPPDLELGAISTYEDSVYVPWLASEYVVVNLPQWITSDSFAQEISSELAKDELNIPFEQIRAGLNADSARSIMVIFINWNDAEEIEAIAQAAITVLKTRNQTYFPQFAAYPAEVIALDDVRVTTVASSLTNRFSPLVRLVVAMAAGVALAITVEYFDDTVRSEEDIQLLDLSVFGILPSK